MSSSLTPTAIFKPLSAYVALHASLSAEGRATARYDPVLLGLLTDGQDSDVYGFHTKFDDEPVGKGSTRGVSITLELLVVPLKKRQEGPFADRIGVGRTRSSDVCLLYNGVSKYHAFFVFNQEGFASTLTDADSKNGTSIDSVRLTPRIPARVVDRSLVSFGSAHFRFHSAEGFRRLLEELI